MFSTRNTTLLSFLFVSMLILIFSQTGYASPMWSDAINATSENYTNSNSSFYVAWYNGTENNTITEVNITANFTGSLANYTMSLNTGDNQSGIYAFNQIIGAGNYMWRSCAKENYTSENCTGYYNFTVGKASGSIHLYLNGNEGNMTYVLNYQNANFTTVFDVQGKNISFSSNYSGFVNINGSNSYITNITNLTTSGLYFINSTFNGDGNYSPSSVTYYFNVSQWSNAWSPSSPTYSPNQPYQFNITYQNKTLPVNNVYFVFNGVNQAPTGFRSIDANTTEYYLNKPDLSANSTGYLFYLFVNFSDNSNVSSNTFNYIVNQRPVTFSWSSPSSSSSWTYNTGISGIIVRCDANESVNLLMSVTVGTTTSYITGSLATVSDTPSSSLASTYYYSCYSANANYSGGNNGILIFQGTTTTTTTTSSSSSSSSSGSFLIKDLTSGLRVSAGQSGSAPFTISNTLANNVVNVNITVSGVDPSWYTLSNTTIVNIIHGTSKSLTLTFNIPSSAVSGEYDITITARGTPLGGSLRTTTGTMTLTVVNGADQPVEPLNITGDLPADQSITNDSVQSGENSTFDNSTSNATGLMSNFHYIQDGFVLLLGVAACLLVFFFRGNITTAMRSEGKFMKKEAVTIEKGVKMPKLAKYKLMIDLKKEGESGPVVKDEKERRPEVLEREIKRDIKELRNVLDTEKKLEKKKSNMENN